MVNLRTDEQLQFFVNGCVGLAVLSDSLQESKIPAEKCDPRHRLLFALDFFWQNFEAAYVHHLRILFQMDEAAGS